jgi:centrosomal protein CEP41
MYDERSGTHYSKILHEKGFDNVYLLSGGIDKFYEDHPTLVEGTDLPILQKSKLNKTCTSKMGKT